ncbi:MAG: hypothetical protein AB1451_00400 [Nitrospirota bacterium]
MLTKKWVMQYGVAVALAALFAAILGHVPLFRETMVGKFRASNLVQFLGYGAALVTILIGARHIATDRSNGSKWLGPFREMVFPSATVVVLALAYNVGLLLLGPVLGKGAKSTYNWMFVISIVAASSWVIATWVRRCAPRLADGGNEDRERAA